MLQPSKPLPFTEFVALIAMMTAIIALAIDAMLPALPVIGRDLNVLNANSPQLVLSVLFLGLAFGQLLFGPLSDSLGRKPPIYLGFFIFIIGSLLSLFATNFTVMLAGRLLQGIGVAGPRAVSIALVRDLFDGDQMAKVMSYVMSVFILVPMLAPAYGQGIMALANWRAIFASLIVLALLTGLWFALRQPETLIPDKRRPYSLRNMLKATKEVLNNRSALAYTLMAGFISGAFIGYLNSAQQIFQDIYQLGNRFPLYFAIIALSLGLASLFNAQLVVRFGMLRLAQRSLVALTGLASLALLVALSQSGQPALWQLMAFLLGCFFCVGILFGNLNALAMQPLGHIAGMGAAIVGALSTLISVPLGTFIGFSFNQTVIPMFIGLVTMGFISMLTMRWAQRTLPPRTTGTASSP